MRSVVRLQEVFEQSAPEFGAKNGPLVERQSLKGPDQPGPGKSKFWPYSVCFIVCPIRSLKYCSQE